jgi:TfoX/Sxy family transcriptional regulator of competence genes
MTVDELFDRIAQRILAEDTSVELDRIFRSTGLKRGGKLFAFVSRGDLVVKISRERVAELVGSGEGRPFESGRRVMKEWVRLSPVDEARCAGYVAEARRFAA